MISCLLVLGAQLGYIPPELAALGKVSEFVDMTPVEDAMVVATSYLTDSGKRFVQKERDFITGQSWTVSNGPNQHYVQYAGDDLFTIESLTPRQSVLHL